MKKLALFLFVIIAASLVWMGLVREPLPPIPEITKEVSPKVKFDFQINTMDLSGVELGLKNNIQGKGLYTQFKMNNAFKTGRPGLILTGMNANSNFKNGMSRKAYLDNPSRKNKKGKDFSDFMKDKQGKEVSTYSFQQVLAEDSSGKLYLQMGYDGPAMEMLQTLEIPHPITVPAHISKQFIEKGVIQFQKGTLPFDKKINGFNIPVVIKGG
jgi:hypothetical protein